MHRALSIVSIPALALLAGGCTAGQIVGDNGDWQIPGASAGRAEVSFQRYSDGTTYTAPVTFHSGKYGTIFSFDPDAPASASNAAVFIPSGDYIVRLTAYYTRASDGQAGWRGYCAGGLLHHKAGVQSQSDYWVSGATTPTTIYRIEVHEGYDAPISPPEVGGEYNTIPVALCDGR